MGQLYDRYKTMIDDLEPNLFEVCSKSESQIDPEAALKTFNFIDKSITINEEITQDTAKAVIELIRFWNQADLEGEGADPIIIYINSPGGDLNATFSIIAAIEMSTTPVYTVNLGRAWSGGFFILIAGHKRFAVPYASYLFHEGSGGMCGDAHKALQEADFYKYQLNQLRDITLDNTKIGESLYEKHKKDDWWFGNETALRYEVIDEVIDNFITFTEEDLKLTEEDLDD